jgi:hypothetical protein
MLGRPIGSGKRSYRAKATSGSRSAETRWSFLRRLNSGVSRLTLVRLMPIGRRSTLPGIEAIGGLHRPRISAGSPRDCGRRCGRSSRPTVARLAEAVARRPWEESSLRAVSVVCGVVAAGHMCAMPVTSDRDRTTPPVEPFLRLLSRASVASHASPAPSDGHSTMTQIWLEVGRPRSRGCLCARMRCRPPSSSTSFVVRWRVGRLPTGGCASRRTA